MRINLAAEYISVLIAGRNWISVLIVTLAIGAAFFGFSGKPARTVASRELEAAHLMSEDAPREIQRLHVDGYINAVAFNADGSKLAALSKFGSIVTIFDTKTWTIVKEFPRYGGAYSFNSLAFLSDNSLLMATPIGDYSKDPRHGNTPLTDPRYNRVDIFALMDWNIETAKPVRYFPEAGYPPKDIPPNITSANTFAVSKSGAYIAAINPVGVLLFNSQSGSIVHILKVPPVSEGTMDLARTVAFSPTGRELAVGTMNGRVLFFDIASGTIVHSFLAYPNGEYACNALAFSPNGLFIATGKTANFDGERVNNVWINRVHSRIAANSWRVGDGEAVSSFAGSLGGDVDDAAPVRSLSWSPSGDSLAVGDGYSFHLWRISEAEPKLLISRVMHLGTYSTAFSPTGILAATDNDQIVIYQ